jgi:hypothetical protein
MILFVFLEDLATHLFNRRIGRCEYRREKMASPCENKLKRSLDVIKLTQLLQRLIAMRCGRNWRAKKMRTGWAERCFVFSSTLADCRVIGEGKSELIVTCVKPAAGELTCERGS